MLIRIFFTVVIISFFGQCFCQALPDDLTVRDLKQGKYLNDSSYVYWLPYEDGRSYVLVQAYDSKRYSHKNEFSLDFKMKAGTKIHAAREGVVIEVKEDSKEGGVDPKLLDDGNHIVIRHSDGTFGGYWHLKHEGVLVNKGDSVSKGQLIGLSGNTGYTAFPHLHFWVYQRDDEGI
jgi:murein DD-endopeptidase MepM/ murein hydrolase activator NlpD